MSMFSSASFNGELPHFPSLCAIFFATITFSLSLPFAAVTHCFFLFPEYWVAVVKLEKILYKMGEVPENRWLRIEF